MRIFAVLFREHSSVGLEHLPYKQRVGGSTPSAPTKSLGEIQGFFRCMHPWLMLTLRTAIKTPLFLAETLFRHAMAIKTAHFLAEMLFRHTLAIKGVCFLAVCGKLSMRLAAAPTFPLANFQTDGAGMFSLCVLEACCVGARGGRTGMKRWENTSVVNRMILDRGVRILCCFASFSVPLGRVSRLKRPRCPASQFCR